MKLLFTWDYNHYILKPTRKWVSYAWRRAAMFKRARWQRWSADSPNHRSSDKWRVATPVHSWQENTETLWILFLPELELKNWRDGAFDHSLPCRKTMCLWNPVLGEWFCKESSLQCHTGKRYAGQILTGTQVKYPALPTNVTVLIFSETHKIRSPEAMTGLMDLLIPGSWKNMRRAWSVVGRHAMIVTKRNRMRRKLKEATRLTQVSILKTLQKSDRRVCLDRQTPKSTSAQNVIKLWTCLPFPFLFLSDEKYWPSYCPR